MKSKSSTSKNKQYPPNFYHHLDDKSEKIYSNISSSASAKLVLDNCWTGLTLSGMREGVGGRETADGRSGLLKPLGSGNIP